MIKILYYASIFGFIMSLITHICSFFGIHLIAYHPFLLWLHILIFVLAPGALIETIRYENNKSSAYQAKPNHYALQWLKDTAKFMNLYCIIIFIIIIFFIFKNGGPSIQNDVPGLYSHGKLIKTLTSKEFKFHKLLEIGLFSCFWMAIYIEFTCLYQSILNRKKM